MKQSSQAFLVSLGRSLALGVFLLGFAASAQGQAKSKSAAPEASPGRVMATAPEQPSMLAAALTSFMPQPKPIELRNAQSEYGLSLPISPRLQIRSAKLHLVATNSMSLLAPRSQLVVRLDGVAVAQIPLDPKLPRIDATITLPKLLLKPGYRRLTFAVAQHYTNECEDPSAAELWTQIDTAKSWIALDGELKHWQPTLAQLPEVFDPKLWGQSQLTILTPPRIDTDVLRWGGLAAQAVALQLGYAPLAVRQKTPEPDTASQGPLRILTQGIVGDAVLVGTLSQIRPWLAPEIAERITGAFLGIVPLDARSQRFVLIASGRSPAEVDRALLAFASLRYPYPDANLTLVHEIDPVTLGRYAGARLLTPNQSVSFARLGVETKTFDGMYGSQSLEFSLPPDLWAPENAYVHLKLQFAYGAGLREDSVVNVFLNDRFQAAIPLNSPNGGFYRDYDLAIPLASFKPGPNLIRFEAAMMPLITGKCVAINMQNLLFTLFSDSRIEIPNAAHVTNLPDLALFSRTGFPYTVPAQGQGMTLAITTASGSEAAAAWMLLAKLAQIQRVALIHVAYRVGVNALARDRDVLLVGEADHLPENLLAQAPLRLGRKTRAPYPVEALPPGPGELGVFEQVARYLRQLLRLTPAATTTQTTWVTQRGRDLGVFGALMQYASPVNKDKVITVLTAANGAQLLAQTEALVHPGVWARLQDDLVLWNGERDFAAQRVGTTFTVGSAGWTVKLGYLMSRAPWLWGILLGTLLMALALVTLRLLMRFKHRRHRGVAEKAPNESASVPGESGHDHTS